MQRSIQYLKFSRIVLILAALVAGIVVLYLVVPPMLRTRGPSAEIKELRRALDPLQTNVLLVTLDTTRPDKLGCYGSLEVQTPHIDEIAQEGVVFRNATCSTPLTLPSHCSILTGTHPSYHGVRDNGGFYLEPDQITLAEILRQRGWATSAFIGAFVLDSRWGVNQGFDYYYDQFDFSKYKTISLDSVQRTGDEVVSAFFKWLEANGDKRFFSWLHFYDPHAPYDPPEPFATQYKDKPSGLYGGEIAYVDQCIGKVVDALETRGLLKNTMIVIVGDHGESLGEHHEKTHGFFIYDATTLVPLILRIPSVRALGRAVASQVETIDLLPTLCDLLEIPIPQSVQGKSLLPLVVQSTPKSERSAYSESYFPRYHFGWSEVKSLRNGRFKYVLAPQPELYDLGQDPGEQVNLYAQNTKLGKSLEKDMQELLKSKSLDGVETRGPQKMDQDAVEKLVALGYVGGFTSQAKLTNPGTLADPKDKIGLFNRIKMAEEDSADGKLDEALEKLTEVISEDPGIMEARQVRAQIYLQKNRPEEAIAEAQEALKIDPEYETAIFTLAQAYKMAKKYESALAGYQRLAQLDPRDPKPYLNMGEIYLATKDYAQAIVQLQRSIELDVVHSAMAHNLLSIAYLKNGEFELAEKETRTALEMRPRTPDAHYNLGLIYEERGDIPGAIREFREEIEIHPSAYPAHFNLGQLLGKIGQTREGIAHLREAVALKKDFANGYLFLAKAYLDLQENLQEAIGLAQEGIRLDPESEYAPLGHYILADIYQRLGRLEDYRRELSRGELLEQKLKRR